MRATAQGQRASLQGEWTSDPGKEQSPVQPLSSSPDLRRLDGFPPGLSCSPFLFLRVCLFHLSHSGFFCLSGMSMSLSGPLSLSPSDTSARSEPLILCLPVEETTLVFLVFLHKQPSVHSSFMISLAGSSSPISSLGFCSLFRLKLSHFPN